MYWSWQPGLPPHSTAVWAFWSARLALQSRDDFSFGLDWTNSYLNSASTGTSQQLSQFTIDMRYYY